MRLFETTFCLVTLTTKNVINEASIFITCAGLQDDFYIPHFSSVIKQCALEHDLELFEAGDNTEVGERGLTLRYGVKNP